MQPRNFHGEKISDNGIIGRKLEDYLTKKSVALNISDLGQRIRDLFGMLHSQWKKETILNWYASLLDLHEKFLVSLVAFKKYMVLKKCVFANRLGYQNNFYYKCSDK